MSRRAVVIGGGHNGLVAAILLAQQGYQVHLCEARAELGGVLSAWDFAGFQIPGLLHDTSCLSPIVVEALQLSQHGLKLIPPAAVLVPNRDGRLVEFAGDEIRGDVPAADLEAYRDWRRFLALVKPVLQRLLSRPVPSLDLGPGDLLGLGSAGLALRLLGQKNMMELVRVLPMAVADWLSDYFETPLLSAGLSFPALFGSFVGPRAAGTAINLLAHECLAGRAVQGGGTALIGLLESRARAAGVEIETSSRVAEIRIEAGRVTGVRAGGNLHSAETVIATCDPAQVFLQLLDPFLLPVKQIDAVQALRSRGVIARVHLHIEGNFELDSCSGQNVVRAYLGADSLDDLERAMDVAKYGQFSRRPALDVRVPENCRSDSGCVLSVMAYGAPFSLRQGWTDDARREFLDAVIDRIESYSRGFRGRVRASELLTPPDLAHHFNLPGGHLCQLEQALDQFAVMRPVPFASRYATPVEGLYLAGSACHPGGGVTGLPGYLGASAALT